MAASDSVRITDADRLGAEYGALTEGCGLVDRSERGKLILVGPDTVEFLNGQVTNELADIAPGEGRYAAFLTHKGKMLGDLRILAVKIKSDRQELLLDTERVALQSLFDMVRRSKVGYRVELHKRTLEAGLLSLIGPRAEEILGEIPGAEEHANASIQVAGLSALAVRTDLGLDLLIDAEHTCALADSLCERGATPVGDDAAEIVRVEHGRPRYGVDMDESTIPQEAGLNERAVSFTKGCYVGQETVARLYYRGKPNRQLRGLRLSAPSPPSSELRLGEKAVGRLTSSVVSPTLGPIGLGLVRREAQIGASLAVGDGQVSATVVELPF